jgi:hypothetical protein
MKKSRDTTNDPEAAGFRHVQARSAGAAERLLAEEGGALTAKRFASLLGVPVGEIKNFCRDRRMFSVPWKGRPRYPACQVHRSRLLPGLGDVLSVLLGQKKLSPLSVVLFFLTEAEALGDERPLDMLRRSQVDIVVRHAMLSWAEGI